jgi:hypothetical protein
VQEMRHSDWEPSPGRYLVLLPLPAGGGLRQAAVEQAAAAEEVQQRFACLAAAFQRETRLAFRVAPVSDAVTRLFAAGRPEDGEAIADGRQRGQQKQQQAAQAFVLHPRRGRFQVLPLRDAQQALRRLEEVLDGGGRWHQAG